MGGIELAKLSEVENPSFFASFSITCTTSSLEAIK